MRRQTARVDVVFAIDVVIAFALCLSVTFFLAVFESRLTRGELTRAQIALMRSSPLGHAVVHGFETRTR
jgi:hypothetical protein